jgi:hypothetical protein
MENPSSGDNSARSLLAALTLVGAGLVIVALFIPPPWAIVLLAIGGAAIVMRLVLQVRRVASLVRASRNEASASSPRSGVPPLGPLLVVPVTLALCAITLGILALALPSVFGLWAVLAASAIGLAAVVLLVSSLLRRNAAHPAD